MLILRARNKRHYNPALSLVFFPSANTVDKYVSCAQYNVRSHVRFNAPHTCCITWKPFRRRYYNALRIHQQVTGRAEQRKAPLGVSRSETTIYLIRCYVVLRVEIELSDFVSTFGGASVTFNERSSSAAHTFRQQRHDGATGIALR